MFKDAKDYDVKVLRFGPMTGKKHSADTRAKMTKRVFEGKSATEWAKIKGVSLARICTLLDQYVTVHGTDRRKLALGGTVAKLYDGKTIKQWAEELGVHYMTIKYRLDTYGSVHGKKRLTK